MFKPIPLAIVDAEGTVHFDDPRQLHRTYCGKEQPPTHIVNEHIELVNCPECKAQEMDWLETLAEIGYEFSKAQVIAMLIHGLMPRGRHD